MDVAQAFNKVWHQFPTPGIIFSLLGPYVTEQKFRIDYENEYSALKGMPASGPQGRALRLVRYLGATKSIQQHNTYVADDTVLLAAGVSANETATRLQRALNKVASWTRK